MEMAVESMEMAPGAIPRPGRVPEQRLLSPETWFRVDGGVGTFRGFLIRCLGFSRDGEYMGPGLAAPGGCLGPPGIPQLRLFAHIFSVSGKPWTPEKKSTKSSVAAVIANPSSGDRSICSGTLPGRGIAPGAISIDSTAITIA